MNLDQIAGQIFDKFDKDKSGTMEYCEVKALLESTYKGMSRTITDKDIQDAIEFMDTDGNGTITRQEYIDMIKSTMARYYKIK